MKCGPKKETFRPETGPEFPQKSMFKLSFVSRSKGKISGPVSGGGEFLFSSTVYKLSCERTTLHLLLMQWLGRFLIEFSQSLYMTISFIHIVRQVRKRLVT